MTDLLPDIGERLFGRPHLIEPAALQARMNSAAWRRVLTGEKSDGGAREVSIKRLRNKRLAGLIEADRVRVAGSTAEYGIPPDGVTVVPVLGVLTARSDWFTALCGWTTYEGLSAIFDSAMREPRVRAILMDVESPGGEAAGMAEIGGDIIVDCRSLDEARAAILDRRAAADEAPEISTVHGLPVGLAGGSAWDATITGLNNSPGPLG